MPEQHAAEQDYSEFYGKQAEHCRWLARGSTDVRTVEKLNELARDFEARAAAMQAAASHRN